MFVSVFLVVTLGFTINKHYSGGELFSFSLFGEPESCCAGVCSCCDEESETVQFLADYTCSPEAFRSAPAVMKAPPFVIALSVQIPEVMLLPKELTDQDLPPPKDVSNLSLLQAFLL